TPLHPCIRLLDLEVYLIRQAGQFSLPPGDAGLGLADRRGAAFVVDQQVQAHAQHARPFCGLSSSVTPATIGLSPWSRSFRPATRTTVTACGRSSPKLSRCSRPAFIY